MAKLKRIEAWQRIVKIYWSKVMFASQSILLELTSWIECKYEWFLKPGHLQRFLWSTKRGWLSSHVRPKDFTFSALYFSKLVLWWLFIQTFSYHLNYSFWYTLSCDGPVICIWLISATILLRSHSWYSVYIIYDIITRIMVSEIIKFFNQSEGCAQYPTLFCPCRWIFSAVVRAHNSHKYGSGSNPGTGIICWLSLLLAVAVAPMAFRLLVLRCSSLHKTSILNSSL